MYKRGDTLTHLILRFISTSLVENTRIGVLADLAFQEPQAPMVSKRSHTPATPFEQEVCLVWVFLGGRLKVIRPRNGRFACSWF